MMKNKRGAAGGLISSKLVTVALVLVVVILVIFLLISEGARQAIIDIIPDFIIGPGHPPDLEVTATVYDTDVKVLINDGYGRCIISKILTTDEQGKEINQLLYNYGLREGGLIRRDDISTDEWEPEETGMQRYTNYMDSNSEIKSKFDELDIREQKVKQDLIRVCTISEDKFVTEEVEISGKSYMVELLRQDENKRCLVYESLEYLYLEHFALKKSLRSSELYYLDDSGKEWKNVEDLMPSEDEVEKLALGIKLISEEKSFGEFISGFSYKYNTAPSTTLVTAIQDAREGNIGSFYTVLSNLDTVTFYKEDASGEVVESYNPVELVSAYNNQKEGENRMTMGEIKGHTYLWYPREEIDLFVRASKVYEGDSKTLLSKSDYPLIYNPDSFELAKLFLEIKKQLIEKC